MFLCGGFCQIISCVPSAFTVQVKEAIVLRVEFREIQRKRSKEIENFVTLLPKQAENIESIHPSLHSTAPDKLGFRYDVDVKCKLEFHRRSALTVLITFERRICPATKTTELSVLMTTDARWAALLRFAASGERRNRGDSETRWCCDDVT